MSVDRKNLFAGAIFCAFGLYFAINAYLTLRLGTALNMGPGYFPLLLGGFLCLLGLIMIGLAIGKTTEAVSRPSWRAVTVISLSIAAFALTVDGLGFLPATALSVFLSAFASRTATVPFAIVLTVALTAFCIGVFHYGLGLAIPLFGTWLGV